MRSQETFSDAKREALALGRLRIPRPHRSCRGIHPPALVRTLRPDGWMRHKRRALLAVEKGTPSWSSGTDAGPGPAARGLRVGKRALMGVRAFVGSAAGLLLAADLVVARHAGVSGVANARNPGRRLATVRATPPERRRGKGGHMARPEDAVNDLDESVDEGLHDLRGFGLGGRRTMRAVGGCRGASMKGFSEPDLVLGRIGRRGRPRFSTPRFPARACAFQVDLAMNLAVVNPSMPQCPPPCAARRHPIGGPPTWLLRAYLPT